MVLLSVFLGKQDEAHGEPTPWASIDFSVNRRKSSLCYTATSAAVKLCGPVLDDAQKGQHHDH